MNPRKSQPERRKQENPKKKKTRKSKKRGKRKYKKMVGEHGNTITTLLTGMGGNQLQPGEKDGGTPIEVVAK